MEYSALTNEDIRKIILESGVVDEKKVEEIEKNFHQEKSTFKEFILSQGFISSEELAKLVADAIDRPFVSLAGAFPDQEFLSLIPEVVARKKKMVAFKKDSQGLHIAMADPTDTEIINFIERKEGVSVVAHVATEQDIDNVLETYGKGLSSILEETFKNITSEAESKGAKDEKESDSSIIQIVREIVIQAYHNRASDIHIEPRENDNSVARFRIDGVLHDVTEIPKEFHAQVISRIKVMAKLRTDEHQIPQDGKIEFPLEEIGSDVDIRVSIVPIVEGEKAVLRLLAERSRQFSLTSVGLGEENLKKIREAYKKPYGMILATGPTGCGKTTTLYAVLKLLNKRQVNIMTIEDPVEYDIEGVNQIQVNPKAKLTFATGLKSILRQDPNIILVGEIRDAETADIAVNLALTGHLILSTLHTNDSATAIPRLKDLGIEPFLIASTTNVIIAQRLVRKIHEVCRSSEKVSAKDVAEKIGWEMTEKVFNVSKSNPDADIRLYQGKGCDSCQGTGFQGRIGIFEVMIINDEIRQAISKNQESDFLSGLSKKAGMSTMLEDGLKKVIMGVTTIDEILGATKL
jgi:type IV pilus assembly protein PilB